MSTKAALGFAPPGNLRDAASESTVGSGSRQVAEVELPAPPLAAIIRECRPAAQGPSTTGTEDRLLLDAAAALSDAQIHRTRNHARVVIDVLQRLELPSGSSGSYHSLPLLEKKGVAEISRLPVSLRILLESVLRNLDGGRIRDQDVLALAAWKPHGPRVAEVPFFVGRVLLQDFTGVPLLVDLAAMRSAVARRGREVTVVQPHVRVDLGDRSLRSGRLLR